MTSLDDLRRSYPLMNGWEAPTLFQETTSVVGLRIHLVGLAARATGSEMAIGSAGALECAPLARAYFELLERASIVTSMRDRTASVVLKDAQGAARSNITVAELFPESTAPEIWSYSRSNGVAIASNWKDACDRALWELIERDRVLRSWYGAILPEKIDFPPGFLPADLSETYDVEAFSFGAASGLDVHVVAVFGFPHVDGAPLIGGLGARPTAEGALEAAWGECLQRLGFLWGEDLPSDEPAFATTPDFHQESFLWPGKHGTLRAWLSGAHSRFEGCLKEPLSTARGSRLFADLTPAELEGRVVVAKAIAQSEIPLTFGCGHPLLERAPPEELRVHPVA
jgi:hypothetical protein